mmetsp:Transcript_38496/g.76323  ORF Transcript_38496/g.76323 Transcript_38496/m.76323 type:complete len:212 (-) Transcript_38496:1126-1761(-)
MAFIRNSSFISDFSVTESPASTRYSTKRSLLILPPSTEPDRVPNTSRTWRVGTRQLFAAFRLLSLSPRKFLTSSAPIPPESSVSISVNRPFSVSMWRARSSSSHCSFSSCSWTPVLVIIFSLTTAVRIDNKVHELVIMKNTNANFSVGNASKTVSIAFASCSDSALLMTRNSVNMLSGTVLKGVTISSSMKESCGNANLWPIRLVVMMAMP